MERNKKYRTLRLLSIALVTLLATQTIYSPQFQQAFSAGDFETSSENASSSDSNLMHTETSEQYLWLNQACYPAETLTLEQKIIRTALLGSPRQISQVIYRIYDAQTLENSTDYLQFADVYRPDYLLEKCEVLRHLFAAPEPYIGEGYGRSREDSLCTLVENYQLSLNNPLPGSSKTPLGEALVRRMSMRAMSALLANGATLSTDEQGTHAPTVARAIVKEYKNRPTPPAKEIMQNAEQVAEFLTNIDRMELTRIRHPKQATLALEALLLQQRTLADRCTQLREELQQERERSDALREMLPDEPEEDLCTICTDNNLTEVPTFTCPKCKQKMCHTCRDRTPRISSSFSHNHHPCIKCPFCCKEVAITKKRKRKSGGRGGRQRKKRKRNKTLWETAGMDEVLMRGLFE